MTQAVGRYTLHTRLAAGGMGAVYLGLVRGEGGFARTVAIKCMHASVAEDREFVSMFLDEARLAARIRHPNVVPTLDVAHEDGELYVVMDYVHGESLSRLLGGKERRPLPLGVAVSIAIGALHGLHAAHEAADADGRPLGIVHRDVSPHNIMVGDDGVPRVVDFGIAKASGRLQKKTIDGVVRGKLAYMAPEQLEGLPVDRRADVFALGVVLWESIVGRRLFRADTDAEMIANLLTQAIRRPRDVVDSIPESIDAIVMKALVRDPAERWSTAREMAKALEKTGFAAPVSDVAEFVTDNAGDALKKRAREVKEMETTGRGADRDVRALINRVASSSRDSGPGTVTLPPRVPEPAAIEPEDDRTDEEAVTELTVTETDSTTRVAITTTPAKAPAPVKAKPWARIATALAVGLTVLVALGFATRRPAPAAPEQPVSTTPSVVQEVIEVATVPAPESAPAPSPSASASAARVAPPKPRPRPAPKPDCRDPYTRDELGRRIYRRECL